MSGKSLVIPSPYVEFPKDFIIDPLEMRKAAEAAKLQAQGRKAYFEMVQRDGITHGAPVQIKWL